MFNSKKGDDYLVILKKALSSFLIAILLFMSVVPESVFAQKKGDLQDQSIYEQIFENEVSKIQAEAQEVGYKVYVSSLRDSSSNIGIVTPQMIDDGGGSAGTGWATIATGSKTLTTADFVASAASVTLLTSLLGWGSVSRTALAMFLGVAVSAVPKALPGEKVYFRREMRWLDKDKYIYDVRTTEYLYRNGKQFTITNKIVRENGWGN